MFIDLRQLNGDEHFAADVCIVGAGAAGITLALELEAAGHSVLLAESGGFEYEQATQALYVGEESGTLIDEQSQYLGATRLRHFGGTTNHWNGWCRPLDREDFGARPWVGEVGWPLDYDTLAPYYARASPWLEISPFDYVQAEAGGARKLFAGKDEAFETNFFHLSPPTRFGSRYRERLANSSKVRVLLHANLRTLATSPEARHVESAELVRLDGRAFLVSARQFVLAVGAIENARLLLANRGVQQHGLGNQHDLVGRYFMDHPTLRVGYVALPYWRRLMAKSYERNYVRQRGNSVCGIVRPRAATQARRELLNSVIVFRPLKGAQRRTLAADIAAFTSAQIELAGHAPPKPGTTYYGWVVLQGEQSPNPASRVRLSSELDVLGMPRTQLEWRLREHDGDSLIATARLLAERLGAASRGRLRILANENDLWERTSWSFHHLGTTRMSEDPKLGVVDPHCRLHGTDNLHLAGSSVFPTSGASNPTYTLVALALRLGDRLHHLLAG